ncbi:MAG: ABC transporter substrate-binding protein [Planctomycetota bacterium]
MPIRSRAARGCSQAAFTSLESARRRLGRAMRGLPLLVNALAFGLSWLVGFGVGCAPEPESTPVVSPPVASSVPQRVVSLAPSLTEILLALGVGDRLVGVTTFCEGVPPAIARVGGLQVDAERIVALRPDYLVAIETAAQAETLLALRRLGIPVEVLPAETIADVRACVAQLAQRFDREPAAEPHLAALDEVLAAAAAFAAVDGAAVGPSAAFVVDWRPLFVAGRGSFVDEMLGAAGVHNAFADRSASYAAVDLEEVLAKDPDFVFDVTLPTDGPVAGTDSWERWQRLDSLRAVRGGRVLPFPPVKPGLRISAWVALLRETVQKR